MTHLRIVFTGHCLQRYMDRVRPGVEPEAAERQLRQMLPLGVVQPGPPDWYGSGDTPDDVVAYFVLGESMALPLASRGGRYYATTCVVPGGLPPGTREARNAGRRGRGQNKRHRKIAERRYNKPKEERHGPVREY